MIEEVEFHNNMFYKDRTIKYRLKDIFSDHWENFIKENKDLNIRPVVLKEVNKMISCRTSDVLIVVNLNFLIILVNLDFVLLVAINMLEKEQRLQ